MKARRLRRKSDKTYWAPFATYLKDALRGRKGDFKVPIEVLIGSPFLLLVGLRVFWLSATCWDRQWKEVLLLLVAAELIPLITGWTLRRVAALWDVCRETRFRGISRDMFKAFFVGVLSVCAWVAYFWHSYYVASPHFELGVEGNCIVANVKDYPGASPSHPTSALVCESVTITNKFAPAMPRDWKAVARVSSCNRLLGKPLDHGMEFGSVHVPVYQGGFIFSEHDTQQMRMWAGLGNGNRIHDPAAFVFEGVREDTLMSPAVELTIECCNGAQVKIQNLVTSQ